MKRTLALIMALVMLLALAACGEKPAEPAPAAAAPAAPGAAAAAPAAPAEEKEKVITVAMTTSMGDLDPFSYASPGQNNMRYFVYEYLAVFTEFGQSWDKMDWQIAKDIRQIDDVTYEVDIYDYVVDALGNPVTAEDVAWCFTQLRDGGAWTRVTRYLADAVALDGDTVQITLKSDVIGCLEYLMVQCKIVSKKTYEEFGEQMSTMPISTAAYQITECVDGSYYVIEKNPNYWQTDDSKRSLYSQQPVDKFIYNVITEASQATIALQMGECDLITAVKTSELGYFINPDGTAMEGYSANSVYNSTPDMLAFNMDEELGLFRDNLPLRQALLYAIDQNSIIKGALGGYGRALFDPAPIDCADHLDSWTGEDYYGTDLEKAKELLAEAGYKDGVDPATGKPLKIRLISDKTREASAVIIQANLMQLGLEIELTAWDDSAFGDYQYDPTQWDIAIFKQGTECYVTSIYDGVLAQNKNGVAAKTFDVDEELEALVTAAHNVSTHSDESIDAMHAYVKDNALLYGLNQGVTFSVGAPGIVIFNHPWAPLVPSACDYSAFFAD